MPAVLKLAMPLPLQRKLIQALTKNERLPMFEHVNYECEKGLRDAAVMILLTFGGLRIGEIAGLRLHDIIIDDASVIVQLPDDIVKHNSSRIVDLWQAPSQLLWRWVQLRYSGHGAKKTAPVFISCSRAGRVKDRSLQTRDIRRLVSKLAAAADMRQLFREKRNRRISNEFNGANLSELAQRFGLSQNHVRRIISANGS
ncbi:MAG: site-specific integrase [Desulfobacteraceae bacterium]|nr:site-specific integrase [Desulfobacteraceae bacterium]